MCLYHQQKYVLFIPINSLCCIQTSQYISCNAYQIPIGLAGIYFAVEAVCSTYDVILVTLQATVDGEHRVKATEATGILSQVQSFKFLIALVLFWRILFCTKSLSDQLQSTSINMDKAADLVNATLDTLQLFRSDLEWQKHYKYTTDIATLHDISVSSPRPQRQRQLPRRM